MAKKKVGRPKAADNFDMAQIELMGRFRATYQTMAEYFGVSTRTIERYMSDDESEFCRSYKKGFSSLKMKLSEAQVKAALGGNSTMLVWLGKQYLGQTDKQDLDITADIQGAPIIKFGDTSKKE